MTEKILFASHVLYYKVKSVVMAKQTVINFLKTCINIYIVLLGLVKLDPMKLGRHGMSFAFVRFHLERLPFLANSSKDNLKHMMVNIVHQAAPH